MNKKILIVEDDLIIALDVKKLLTDEGYQIIGVVKSISGLNKILKKSKPDLIISDLILDKNSRNFEKVIFNLKNLHIPFIILSSVSNNSELNDKFFPEKINFLAKPFDSVELLQRIDEVFNRQLNTL